MTNSSVSTVAESGRQIHDSTWVDRSARAGLVAYGAVHLLLAWVALQVAFGGSGREVSNQGAFAELVEQPFGRTVLGALCVGLLLLVVWQVLEAGFGHRDDEGLERWGRRGLSLAKAALYGAVAFVGIRVLVGAGSSGGGRSTTATVMGWPGGQWLVALVGVGVLVFAVVTGWRGWQEKFLEHLDAEGRSSDISDAYRWAGKIGHLAKGAAYGIVGVLVVQAGRKHQGGEDKGLGDALRTLVEQPFGPYLLAVVAFGFACFGLFTFARARHLDR